MENIIFTECDIRIFYIVVECFVLHVWMRFFYTIKLVYGRDLSFSGILYVMLVLKDHRHYTFNIFGLDIRRFEGFNPHETPLKNLLISMRGIEYSWSTVWLKIMAEEDMVLTSLLLKSVIPLKTTN